jgi:hypothetical protein
MKFSTRKCLKGTVALLAFALAGSIQAATVNFIDAHWSGAAWQHSYDEANVDGTGITVTATAFTNGRDGRLTYNNSASGGADGLGVLGNANWDEIDGTAYEKIVIDFSQAVTIDAIQLTDLFHEGGITYDFELGEYAGGYLEEGEVWINGDPGTALGFTADEDQYPSTFMVASLRTNGEKTLDDLWGATLVNSISFIALDFENHDYSLASIDFSVSQVPLPATVWLFGSAIAGFGFLKYRRKENALAA